MEGILTQERVLESCMLDTTVIVDFSMLLLLNHVEVWQLTVIGL